MDRLPKQTCVRALLAVAVLIAGSIALGCSSEVQGGGEGGGGGSSSSSSSDAGSGDAGSGDAGSGDAGSGDAGSGDAGSGDAGDACVLGEIKYCPGPGMGYESKCIDKGGTLAWDPPCCEGVQVPDCSNLQ